MPRRYISFKDNHGRHYRFPLKDVCYIERMNDAVRIVYALSNWFQRGIERAAQGLRAKTSKFCRRHTLKQTDASNAILRPYMHIPVYAKPDSVVLQQGSHSKYFSEVRVMNTDHVPYMPGWMQLMGRGEKGLNKPVFLNLPRIRAIKKIPPKPPAKNNTETSDLVLKFGGTGYDLVCSLSKKQVSMLRTARTNALLISVTPHPDISPLS